MTPRPSSDISRRTSPGSQTSTRFTGRSRSRGSRNALSMPMKWPTGAPVICGGPPSGKRWSSWWDSKPIVRWECTTPFGFRGRPRGETDERRGVGINRLRAGDRVGVEERGEGLRPNRQGVRCGLARHQPARTGPVGEQPLVVGQVVDVTEAVGGHDDVGGGRPEDVVDLFRPVEVHDGYHDRSQVGRRPEGDAGLDPVRELEHDDGTRAHALRLQRRGQRTRRPVDVGERAVPGMDLRPNVELGVAQVGEAVGDHRPEGGVGPPPLGAVVLGQVLRQRSSPPPLRPAHVHSPSRWRTLVAPL